MLEIQQLSKTFSSGPFWNRQHHHALTDISFDIGVNKTSFTGIVGESGSGKTTLALLILGFLSPTKGKVTYRGKDINQFSKNDRNEFIRKVQPIYQDPFASFNPFYKIDRVLTYPLIKFNPKLPKSKYSDEICSALDSVGLEPRETLGRFPHQLSGGQRQRLMLARCLLCKPEIIIADEPVSMIDASLRTDILAQLKNLNLNHQISILYITHDLTTAYNACDDLVVMKNGFAVEIGNCKSIIKNPKNKYTQDLIGSIPTLDIKQNWLDS